MKLRKDFYFHENAIDMVRPEDLYRTIFVFLQSSYKEEIPDKFREDQIYRFDNQFIDKFDVGRLNLVQKRPYVFEALEWGQPP